MRQVRDAGIGKKYGRLLVLRRADKKRYLVCVCDCGNTKIARWEHILSGDVRSCGCYRRDVMRAKRTHGHTASGNVTPEFSVWCGIKQRCYNKGSSGYRDYGGRGIRVCARWRVSFEAFFDDMGPRPSDRHSIDRKNNNGNYCPSNCRWATPEEQARNKRSNTINMRIAQKIRKMHASGMSIKEVSASLGVYYGTAHKVVNGLRWREADPLTRPCKGEVTNG